MTEINDDFNETVNEEEKNCKYITEYSILCMGFNIDDVKSPKLQNNLIAAFFFNNRDGNVHFAINAMISRILLIL